MIWFQIFWEFFKAGLFAAGGGLATLPFLYAISESTGWFSTADIANMIAISESTPGPLGVNMATYAGYQTLGIAGGIWATRLLPHRRSSLLQRFQKHWINLRMPCLWKKFSTDSAPVPSL